MFRIALLALGISKARAAQLLQVDKSLVGRWAAGSVHPTEHNISRITALMAQYVPQFSMQDWQRDIPSFSALLGVDPGLAQRSIRPPLAVGGGTLSVWSFEVGARLRSDDGRFSLSTSGYYLKWSDIQTTITLPTCFSAYRDNAGSARSVGFELEASFQPTPETEVFGTVGLIDSRLTQDVPFAGWHDGDRVPSVSPVQINFGLRQSFRLFRAEEASLRLDYSYVTRTHTNFDVNAPSNRFYGGYGVFNLVVATSLAKEPPTGIALFVRNLTDSQGRVAAMDGNIAAPERYVTVRPRTIGVTLRTEY